MKRALSSAILVCIVILFLLVSTFADARDIREINAPSSFEYKSQVLSKVSNTVNSYPKTKSYRPAMEVLNNYSCKRNDYAQTVLEASTVNVVLDSSVLGKEQDILNEYESAINSLMSGETPILSPDDMQRAIESVLDDLSRTDSGIESNSNKPSSTSPETQSSSTTPYQIHIISSANGSIQVSHQSATKGTPVSITLLPSSGYCSKSVTVEGTNLAGFVDVSGSGNNYSFIMPGKQVTVSASFERIQREDGQPASSNSQSIGNSSFSQLEGLENSDYSWNNVGETLNVSYVMRPIIINNHPAICATWMIGGSSYFRIRDLAYLFSDTNLKFNPVINGYRLALQSGIPYSTQGDELQTRGKQSVEKVQPMSVTVNSVQQSEIKAFMIDGECCVCLLDLGKYIGFDVDYNSDTNTIIISFPVPESIRQFSFYSKHYGVPSFQFVFGVAPYSENDSIHAYSFSALRDVGHAYDCVASYAKVLKIHGFAHTRKFSDREGHPVALFESKTKNRLVLIGSTSQDGCSVITIVVEYADKSDNLLDLYEAAVAQL